ncbi:SMP-30/gluconolactonase/LRE family protein [Sediminibacterium soli]|uniref:ATP/GTP-binding protein n=1 Tax=Sediminibacterium soli TaxID=2698829 RepID=UPI00137B49DE|nr:ATP/GTP-binding protein [Sediminibacterium soli]NCI45027.1 ATP/GTP-binding protein [Sediminibacterium soli]
MRKICLSLIVLLTCSQPFAQRTLEKAWESDSVTLKGPESATYDPKSNSIYVSSMNAGSIVRMDVNGRIIKSDWVTGLTSNKGLGFYNGLLYTAETAAVAVIDIDKATIIKRIPIEGAGMLNDLEVDAKGIVYVSDTRTSKVHRIENDKASVYLENIAGANGLMAVGDDLYVVGSASFQKVNANKEITKIGEGYENGLDGIVMLSKNEFILSNYRGMLYYVNADGNKQVLLDTRASRIMANDISYNSKTKTLYVPSFSSNRIIAYTVK